MPADAPYAGRVGARYLCFRGGRAGEVSTRDVPGVSLFSAGVLHGVGVFEVFRVYGGKAHALSRHLARLEAGARALGMQAPLTRSEMFAEVRRCIAEAITAGLPGELRARVVWMAGEGDEVVRWIALEPLAPHADAIEASRVEVLPVAPLAAPGLKSLSYLPQLLAQREAKRRGADTAVFVDDAEQLWEGALANVFALSGDTLVTPPLQGPVAILPGVTRAVLLELASSAGLAVREEPISAALWQGGADGLFLSSSVRGIVPIAEVRRGDARWRYARHSRLSALEAHYRATIGDRLDG